MQPQRRPRRIARIRPGRAVSLVGAAVGIGVLMVALSSGVADAGGGFGVLFVLAALAAIGMSLYNALSERGIAEYEVEVPDPAQAFCPHCGGEVGGSDKFYRRCGGAL